MTAIDMIPLIHRALLALLLACSLSPAFPEEAGTPRETSGDQAPDFWLAAARGDLAALKAGLEAGQAVDQLDNKGDSALIHALRQKQFAASELLLARGANPSQNSADRFSALDFAFWAGIDRQKPSPYDGRWLRLLLDSGADIHASSKYREPLLARVAREYPPRPDALALVLTYRPHVDQRYGARCETALMSVAGMGTEYHDGSRTIVRRLLEAGANPNLTSLSNHSVGRDRSYPTPLLMAASRYRHDESGDGAQTAERAAHLELINLLLQHGADPRFGGIGGRHEDHESLGCAELPEGAPGTSGSAGAAWDDFSGSPGNPALSELLGQTASDRAIFDRILAAASPIRADEIAYPALDSALGSYTRVVESLEMIESGRYPSPKDEQRRASLLARKVELEHALATLLELGVPVNPQHLMLPPESDWQELWIARRWPEIGGIEHLPLFEYRMPDTLYQAFLQAGANPAIRPGGHFSKGHSLLTHLITHNAASKLGLLETELGLLARVPSWCGRSVFDIGTALGRQASAAHSKLATPTGQAAKRILLALLDQPKCTIREDYQRQTLPELLGGLGDPEIERAFAQSALAPANSKRAPGSPGRTN